MKNTIKKISKFIASRALYFALGICIAITVSAVYAAVVTWPAPQVTSGNTLTAELWNTFAENLDDLNSRVNSFTDTDTWRPKGTAIYKTLSICTAPNVITTATTCSTRVCKTFWGFTFYYQCDGACFGGPVTCSNTLLGYLVD